MLLKFLKKMKRIMIKVLFKDGSISLIPETSQILFTNNWERDKEYKSIIVQLKNVVAIETKDGRCLYRDRTKNKH